MVTAITACTSDLSNMPTNSGSVCTLLCCLLQLLPALLNADGLSKAVNLTLNQGWLPAGEQTWFLRTSDSSAPGVTDLVMIELELINGAGYATYINVKDACLDLRVLPQLVAALPQLREFRCVSCNRCSATLPPEARMLPEELHLKAPASMTSLDLSLTNVTGILPKWINWTTIEVGCCSDDAARHYEYAWRPPESNIK
jgi:hypothetical protein